VQRSQVGKYFEETLELTNRSRWPKLWVEVHDFSDLPGHHVSRVVNSLGRHSTSRWQVRTLCRRRGRFQLGPITLTSGDPLGIFRFTRQLPDSGTLVISPATLPIPEFSPPTGYLPGGEAVHRRTPYVTSSVSGIRDYVPGDSFNRIHWPSTARTGRLVLQRVRAGSLGRRVDVPRHVRRCARRSALGRAEDDAPSCLADAAHWSGWSCRPAP
jgi:uncharacterized protein (DUF58 family)